MKILVLCDRYPSVMQDGLVLRLRHFVTQLAGKHTFDLLCYGGESKSAAVVSLFGNIDVLPYPTRNVHRGLSRLLKAFSADEICQRSPATMANIERVIAERSYDLIWDAGGNMLVNLPENARQLPLIADLVDEATLPLLREIRTARSLTRALVLLKRVIVTRRFEKRYVGPADVCVLASELDAKVFSGISPDTPVKVIQNGVDEQYFQPLGLPPDEFNIVFEGSISFPPNRDAVLYFVREIFPLIQSVTPRVTLTVVGREPPPDIQALASDNIKITGYVDDVRIYLDRACVFVCPLRQGAGIKNKILQAWSMGKAVVATPASIGGLAVREGDNILVRETPKSFAEAVINLLQQPEMVAQLGNSGRRTIVDHYSWRQKALELETLMLDVCRHPKIHNC